MSIPPQTALSQQTMHQRGPRGTDCIRLPGFARESDQESGCQILWEDSERVFCEGWRLQQDGGRSPVLVILPAAPHPSASTLDRLAHEYGLKEDLDGPWAVRPLEIVRDSGRTMLVLEHIGGLEPLERLIGPPMEIASFLRLAAGIASTIGQMHRHGILHKNIKPANILVDRTTGETRLTGFGIASRLPRERQAPDPPETIAGTLAYMAPEQTGRMNRSIDARSDLYALGVTLYQMLTGDLPFRASDPLDWVHCHIARKPVPLSARLEAVSNTISAIVMKLLAKAPEERYQTAAGVERDLHRCRVEWERQKHISDFPVGQDDAQDRLLIPEKLYGRDREVEILIASFERVIKTGTTELVLVSGYSGIGKSSVINELHKVLVPSQGLFAAGKFDQYKRDIPYSTLAQAFQSLVRALLGKSDADLSGWRDVLSDALGPNGRLMVDLVPELKLIVGEQPAVPELPPQDAQRRFQLVFRRFIGVFARSEHPLVLFLDDLQWLDTATLYLLEYLATQSDLHHLLLIGAYRTNEVTDAHPLMERINAIKTAGGKVEEIVLGSLASAHLGQLIADALRCSPERAAPLAQLIHEKTDGNPFFAIQFLSSLAEEGLIHIDSEPASWIWDLDRIHTRGFTDNVVELMVKKLSRLPPDSLSTLQLLACLGNKAEITDLAIGLDISQEQVDAVLLEAARQGLVERLPGGYRFVHDRVQEAAYSLIAEEERAAVHLRIGRRIVAETPPAKRDEAIFEIVNQLNRGSALLLNVEERDQLAEFNLIAANRAKASTAYELALKFFVAGTAMLTEERWERRRELAFALELGKAECEFLTGEVAVAEDRLITLRDHAATLPDLAAITRLRVPLYMTLDQSDRAVAVGLEYMQHAGVTWSPHPSNEEIRAELDQMWDHLESRSIEALVSLPTMSNPVWSGTMDVLAELLPAAVFTDGNLHCLIIGRIANLSLEHGNCAGSCFAYVWLGMLMGPQFGDYETGFRFGQLGVDLIDKLDLLALKARVYLGFAHVVPWTRPLRMAVAWVRTAIEAAQQTGDLSFASISRGALITHLLACGESLDRVEREAESSLDFAKRARFGLVADVITGQLRLIRALRGHTADFGSFFTDSALEERKFEAHLAGNPRLAYAAWRYWIRKLQVAWYAADYASAIEAAAKAEQLNSLSFAAYFEIAEYHFYAALARAACLEGTPAEKQSSHLDLLLAHHRQLESWARHCPENFENRAALVGAEIARIEGRLFDAMRLYERAIQSAHANGFVQNEAIANEVAARFYEARGFKEIAKLYRRTARHCYAVWGADGKARQLDERHPQPAKEEVVPTSISTIGARVEELDLATVIKASQAVSGEINLDNLINTLMRNMVALAGAERVLLILVRDATAKIAAEATTIRETVYVQLRDEHLSATTLPESVFQYVLNTREAIILDDASVQSPFAADPYVAQSHARSVLCLPLLHQTKLVGVMYLENNLAPSVFVPGRIAVLKLLASQAATALENSRLYRDLAEREAKIRRLVDANIIGIVTWHIPRQGPERDEAFYLEVNDAFLRMLGYDRSDFESGRMRRSELTPPEWRERDIRTVSELREFGVSQPFEKEYVRKDGTRLPVLVGGVSFDETRTSGVAFVLDLSERKRIEKRLLAHHAVTRALGEVANIDEAAPKVLEALCSPLGWDLGAAWRVDRDAGVLRCAAFWRAPSVEAPQFELATRAMQFRPGDGLPGQVWAERAPQWIQEIESDSSFHRAAVALREGLRSAVAFPIVLSSEFFGVIEFFSRDGHQADQHLLEMMDTIGSQIGQFIERKRAESALQRAQAELAHVTRVTTLSELTATIAHEVNQPIAAAVIDAGAALRFLNAEPPALDEVRAALEAISHHGRRAGEVVGRIRDLIRKVPPRRGSFDINDAAREVIELTRSEAIKNAASVQIQLGGGLPLILGDRVQLQQVMLNLIVNSIEAMSNVHGRPRELQISTAADSDGGVRFMVRDTGPGLDPTHVDRIFERFYTTKATGLGMGLAICRSIIEAHSGRIWASANEPHGAVFEFVLPSGRDGTVPISAVPTIPTKRHE